MSALLHALGRPDDARLVVVTLDGLGACNAGNEAIRTALFERSGREPIAASTALQVPCPWARGSVELATAATVAVGVELTLNCAPSAYRWGSLTRAPSLSDGDGGLPGTVRDLLEHADTPEIRRECRAQILRAQQWGVNPEFLTSHLDALAFRPEFFDVLIELATEFCLPIRLPDRRTDLGFDARSIARQAGVLVPDRVIQAPPGRDVREAAGEALGSLTPGVTEIVARPALDTPELRAMTPHWAARVGDAHLVTHDWAFRSLLHRTGASLTSWRELHRAQVRLAPSVSC